MDFQHELKSFWPRSEGVYSEDPLRDDEIRILTILPASEDDPVCCTLETVRRSDVGLYKALSYVWGDEADQIAISVNDKSFHVRRNLYHALVALRNPRTPLRLWVDAVCINQTYVNERSRQVQRMGEVYAGAEEVFIWLGNASRSSRILQDTCELALNCETLGLEGQRSKWSALKEVLSRPWFSRLWVLQEAVLAKKATFVLGREYCDLDIFRHVNWFNILSRCTLTHMCATETELIEIGENLSGLQDLVALIERQSRSGEAQLVYDCIFRQCTDPRDCIFGLVGMAQHFGWKTADVDYTQSKCEVYYRFMKDSMKLSPMLLVPFLARAPGDLHPDWPSWVPDLAQRPQWLHYYVSAYEAGMSIDGRLSDSAFSDSQKSVCPSGIMVDRIRAHHFLDIRTWDHPIFSVSLSLADFRKHCLDAVRFWEEQSTKQSAYRDMEGRSQAYLQTLSGNLFDPTLQRCGTSAVSEVSESDVRNFYRLVFHDGDDSLMERQGIRELAYYMIMTLERRSLLVTDKGYIGVGPREMTREDAIIVFAGIQMPFVVRRQPHKNAWRLIGPAYVHGVMTGEAFEGKSAVDLEQFIIY